MAFSAAEALDLGRFVLTAYDLFTSNDPPVVNLPAGYSLVSKIYADDITDDDPTYFVFGFIATKGTDAVVAIRGTEGILEWIRDLHAKLVDFPATPGGKVEQGFAQFYASLRTGPGGNHPRVAEVLDQLVPAGVTTLRLTGHSLGSALATLLAAEVAVHTRFQSPVVYTFASPRVGDKVFAGTYDSLVQTSWRISNMNDIIPHLPPQWVGYVHVDAEIPINSDDRCQPTFKCWHQLRTYLSTFDSTIPLDTGCVPS